MADPFDQVFDTQPDYDAGYTYPKSEPKLTKAQQAQKDALARLYPTSTPEYQRANARSQDDPYPEMRRQQEQAGLEAAAARAVTEATGWVAEERAADERRQQRLAARYPSAIPHYNARKQAEEAGK